VTDNNFVEAGITSIDFFISKLQSTSSILSDSLPMQAIIQQLL